MSVESEGAENRPKCASTITPTWFADIHCLTSVEVGRRGRQGAEDHIEGGIQLPSNSAVGWRSASTSGVPKDDGEVDRVPAPAAGQPDSMDDSSPQPLAPSNRSPPPDYKTTDGARDLNPMFKRMTAAPVRCLRLGVARAPSSRRPVARHEGSRGVASLSTTC